MSERGRRPPTLVVLRALGLGDFLTAVPALRALTAAFPEHRRVLAAPRPLRPLLELLDEGWTLLEARPLAPLPPSLDRPEVAVNLHGRGPESHRVLLAARPRQSLWFANSEVAESAGAPRWRPGEHEVERWCRLLREYAIPPDPRWLELPVPAVGASAGAAGAEAASGEGESGAAPAAEAVEGATVLHPGAASPARRWPIDRFAAVARAERQARRSVLVTGSREELPIAEAVARSAGLPERTVLAGRTGLAELAAVIARAGRLVAGDTGVAHLATALGTPSVVLFGPTSPAEWGPPPDRPWHRVLWAGGRGDPHAARPDPGLLAIGVDDVLAALAALPPARRAAEAAPARG